MRPGRFVDPQAAAAFSPQKMKKVNLFESAHMFCDVYGLEPGQSQPEHVHEGSDKVYYAVSGTCEVQLGAERRPLEPGQLAVAPAGVAHALHNTSAERATLLVVMAPHPSFQG